ncbi:MAG: diaminopimelate epimerase [Candidatus Omnitrophica bacterium]|nr:diaminopimelate epimerase [Candidatus Omnitrophota bacterium]
MKKNKLCFTKVVASGNDFILLNNKKGEMDHLCLDYPDLARDLCRRRYAVGADGILVLERSGKADFRMRIINSDGSEADMCGNGARCSAWYASANGWGNMLTIETGAGIIEAVVKDESVKLKMSDPKEIKLNIDLETGSGSMTVHKINTGVPHAVQIVEDLDNYNVQDIGRKVRQHPLFAPAGTNADFVGKVKNNSASVRVYERGVEDETLACGTGTVASAVILGLLGKVTSPVKMLTKSGEVLTVYFSLSNKKVTDVFLEGKAQIVYEGKL